MFFRFGQKPAFRVRELQLVMKMMDTIGFLFQFSLCTKRFLHRKNRKCANMSGLLCVYFQLYFLILVNKEAFWMEKHIQRKYPRTFSIQKSNKFP